MSLTWPRTEPCPGSCLRRTTSPEAALVPGRAWPCRSPRGRSPRAVGSCSSAPSSRSPWRSGPGRGAQPSRSGRRPRPRFWDGVAGQSFAAVYVGSEQIQGLGVYKFVQRIDKVTIPQHLAGGQVSQTVDVPGKFFGLPPSSPAVKATDTYSNTRTLWVEPQTGSIIKGTEDLNRVFVYNGVEVPELVGQIGYTDQTVSAGVALAKDSATGLYLVRVLLPAVLIGLGVLLAIAGSVLVFVLRPSTRGGRRSAGVPPQQGLPSSGVIDLTALDREHADGVS